jgi:hypothetical protein
VNVISIWGYIPTDDCFTVVTLSEGRLKAVDFSIKTLWVTYSLGTSDKRGSGLQPQMEITFVTGKATGLATNPSVQAILEKISRLLRGFNMRTVQILGSQMLIHQHQ